MSAFVVSENHTRFVVNASLALGVSSMHPTAYPIRVRTPEEVGQMLMDANVNSVNHRYRYHAERTPTPTFSRGPLDRFPASRGKDLAQIIMAVDCLDYQCCEVDDWEDTDACKFLRSVKDAAVRRLTYDTFPYLKWCIE